MTRPAARNSDRFSALLNFLKSQTFFIATLVFFFIQAFWQAVIAKFPMGFDEDTHFNTIKLYASQPNPFFTHQPTNLDKYGALLHNPSYFYHYLMALPWRLVSAITDNFMLQIIFLRVLNIGLFILGLVLFRKLLLHVTNRPGLVNCAFILVVLTPITSQLASQINYDNLMIPLLVANLLVFIKIIENLKQDKVDIWLYSWFVVLAAITAITKYTYLTTLIPLVIIFIWQILKTPRLKQRRLWKNLQNNISKTSTIQKVLLVIILIFSMAVVFERYGLNTIRYHAPIPNCVKVLGEKRCQQFSIYQRSQLYKEQKPAYIDPNPLLFTYRWLKHLNFNLMMSLSSPEAGYSVGMPLPLPYIASIIFGTGGLILAFVYRRRIFNNSTIRLLVLVFAFYAVSLWSLNYIEYLRTGRRVAIQGRYLIPFLPFIYLTFLLAFNHFLAKKPIIFKSFVAIIIFAFFMGGGAATFIVHSDDSWYWDRNYIRHANNGVRQVIRHSIPPWQTNYKPYYQSSFSF